MSSNAKLLNMDTQQIINFTENEISSIESIASQHRSLHEKAISLHHEIEKSNSELNDLIKELEFVKEKEILMYKELSEKYDLSENTISQAAANYILSKAK